LVLVGHDGNRKTQIKTLENLKVVQADVIIASVALESHQVAELTENEWHTDLDAAIASLV
jgi:hypothetical protein